MQDQVRADQALQLLVEGNRRFVTGTRSVESVLSALRLRELAEKGQRPFAIVLTCSDSRVPTEMVFDRGLGDLFVIRVAGNVVAPSLLASLEFAALNFKTELVVVMGHTECGAVKAALQYHERPDPSLTFNLRELVERIGPAVEQTRRTIRGGADPKETLLDATWRNVRHSMTQIQANSPVVEGLVREGRLKIVGSVFDLHTGKVEFDAPEAARRAPSVASASAG